MEVDAFAQALRSGRNQERFQRRRRALYREMGRVVGSIWTDEQPSAIPGKRVFEMLSAEADLCMGDVGLWSREFAPKWRDDPRRWDNDPRAVWESCCADVEAGKASFSVADLLEIENARIEEVRADMREGVV